MFIHCLWLNFNFSIEGKMEQTWDSSLTPVSMKPFDKNLRQLLQLTPASSVHMLVLKRLFPALTLQEQPTQLTVPPRASH